MKLISSSESQEFSLHRGLKQIYQRKTACPSPRPVWLAALPISAQTTDKFTSLQRDTRPVSDRPWTRL